MGETPNEAALTQPAPVTREGAASMHDLVCEDLVYKFVPGMESNVVQDLEARKKMGLEKYGTVLQAFNGRDAIMDAYQETLDLTAYLKQAIIENPGDLSLPTIYSRVLEVALFLRRRIESRA